MMSKGKSIAHESESNRLRKKQKIGAEGLDENILNILSEASRNEISLLKSQYLAMKERDDICCSGGSSDVKDVQGSSGAKDKTVLEIVDEEDEDNDDDGVDNPNDGQGHGEGGEGYTCGNSGTDGQGGASSAGGSGNSGGEGDASGASGEGEMEGQGGAGGDSGGGIGGDKGGDDGGNSRKGTTESNYSDLDGSDDDDIDEVEVVFDSAGDKQVYETAEGEVLKEDETVEDSDIEKFGWVKHAEPSPTPLFQNIVVNLMEEKNKIISRKKLSTLDIINTPNYSEASDLQVLIRNQCEHGFTTFKPQKTHQRRSKKVIDPVTGKGKIRIFVKPANVIHTVKIPLQLPVMLSKFDK
ncbi:hypothetical protein L1987_33031 [Smallanthus sonchifolius]|uniref:Uncharacterized protein n=1 Tax=Smallanthus sonchifolius TaxID=185202 RepID=A0ACB9HP78_9ASTR|nr:hypothetical protein L1987_33031 [Smallanthus sonchifolius]